MMWLAIGIGVVAIVIIFAFMTNKWADKANLKIAIYVIDAEENTGKEIQIPYPYPYVTKVLSEIYPLVVVSSSTRAASAQLDSGMLLTIAEDENRNTLITAFTSLEEQRRSNAELRPI